VRPPLSVAIRRIVSGSGGTLRVTLSPVRPSTSIVPPSVPSATV
jgi:hypothetical protein